MVPDLVKCGQSYPSDTAEEMKIFCHLFIHAGSNLSDVTVLVAQDMKLRHRNSFFSWTLPDPTELYVSIKPEAALQLTADFRRLIY